MRTEVGNLAAALAWQVHDISGFRDSQGAGDDRAHGGGRRPLAPHDLDDIRQPAQQALQQADGVMRTL